MSKFLESVEKYYNEKILTHGTTALGVDWSSESGQLIRFKLLSDILPKNDSRIYSILDFGSGYGAFADYLANQQKNFNYYAFDISEKMRSASRSYLRGKNNCTVLDKLDNGAKFDFVVINGTFNVKLSEDVYSWRSYVLETIESLYAMVDRAITYNLLSSFSDFEYQQDYLFYENPGEHLNFLLGKYGRKVEINHSTSLYEFTVVIHK